MVYILHPYWEPVVEVGHTGHFYALGRPRYFARCCCTRLLSANLTPASLAFNLVLRLGEKGFGKAVMPTAPCPDILAAYF